jgi:LysW-gamma-L-lysine carboxypeptidase
MSQLDSVKFLQKMLEIYSPSGQELKISGFLENKLKSFGYEKSWIDKIGNVYGEIGSGSPTIILCGHMDTVPGEIPVKISDGRLYGRGAVDAKSSLAAMIYAVANIKNVIKRGRVILIGLVAEELDGRGVRQLLRENLKIDYSVFGEPSGIGNITFAYKGRIELQIECKNKTGHVGATHLYNNAIEKVMKLWYRIKDVCEQYQSPHGIFYSLTPCLTGISSFRSSGGIPDMSILDIDLRLPPTICTEKGIALISEINKKFMNSNRGTTIVTKVKDAVEPYVANRRSLVMKSLEIAIKQVTGKKAKFIRKTGTGDMNIFGKETSIPVATFGPGNASLSHTKKEYIDISEYLLSIKIIQKAISYILLHSTN